MTVIDEAGNVTGAARTCLELIKKYDMILATGHLGKKEILGLVKTAREIGLRKVVVTHAEFPSQNLSPQEQVELAELGAIIEHCFTTMHTGKSSWEGMFEATRKVGIRRTMMSTDLGQTINPGVAAGYAMFAQKMLDAGFTVEEIRHMAATIPASLVE
jgi:hypothetical protein